MSLSGRLDRLEREDEAARGWTEVWMQTRDDPTTFDCTEHPELGRLTEDEIMRREGRPLRIYYLDDVLRPNAFTLDFERMRPNAADDLE